MPPISSYKDLRVWKTGLKLVGSIYRVSKGLPVDERYGLISQLRRASVSVVANIAEGNGRLHRAEYIHHLSIARGSLLEVEALLYTSIYLEYLTSRHAAASPKLVDEVSRMLTRMVRSLKA
jgi:four helix bundle protein